MFPHASLSGQNFHCAFVHKKHKKLINQDRLPWNLRSIFMLSRGWTLSILDSPYAFLYASLCWYVTESTHWPVMVAWILCFSISRYLGLSGNHGNSINWMKVGTTTTERNRGQCSSCNNFNTSSCTQFLSQQGNTACPQCCDNTGILSKIERRKD